MTIPEMDIDTLESLWREGAVVIDVREPAEYDDAHVPGAVLIPLGEIESRVDECPADETFYVICRSGGRSANAVEWLIAQNVDAVNIAGGTLGWISGGHDVAVGREPGSPR